MAITLPAGTLQAAPGSKASDGSERAALPNPAKSGVAGVSESKSRSSFPYGLPSGSSFAFNARKLPVLVLGLIALATVLVAVGELWAQVPLHPRLARTLDRRRGELVIGGLFALGAAIALYPLV